MFLCFRAAEDGISSIESVMFTKMNKCFNYDVRLQRLWNMGLVKITQKHHFYNQGGKSNTCNGFFAWQERGILFANHLWI